MDRKNPDPTPASLRPFGERLLAAQLAIYRAEWRLEAEGDMAAVPDLVGAHLQFHGLSQSEDLAAALKSENPDNHAVLELKRLRAHAVGISPETMQQAVGAALECLQAWHAARAGNGGSGDFSLVAEPLRRLIDAQRQLAQVKAHHLSDIYGRSITPYEALIDAYDPGRGLSFIKAEFARLVPVCQRLLDEAPVERQQSAPSLFPPNPDGATEGFGGALQQLVGEIIGAMGYDATPPHGRLSTSAHPFCRRTGEKEVWLTAWSGDAAPLDTLVTMVHEGGHGRYYQGLAGALGPSWSGMVAGESLNEGMALLAEHVIARRLSFSRYLAPKISRTFGIDVTAETLHEVLNRPTRDRLRATAGEAVYPLHLVLRTEMEEALIDGGLEATDLPHYWNQRSAELLGFTPDNDNEGCLQDIQLFAGYLGYFPCYLLGHMAAAQLWPALESAVPELDDQIAEGDFAGMNRWLHNNIYAAGRIQPADLLLHRLTGTHFGADALIGHLQARYGHRDGQK